MKINKFIVLKVLVTVNDGKIEWNKYIARWSTYKKSGQIVPKYYK